MKDVLRSSRFQWTVVGATVAIVLGVATNLVTQDRPPGWIIGSFALLAVLSVCLTGYFEARAMRNQRAEARARRDQYLLSFNKSLSSVGHTLASVLDPLAGVSPFMGRTQELTDLLTWCTTVSDERIRVLDGPSGVGKTRLAREVGRSLPVGWAAGLIVAGWSGEAITTAVEAGDPTLIVVDDADTVPEVINLVDTVSRSSANENIRLLLVPRDASGFTKWIAERGPSRLASHWPTTTMRVVGSDGDRRRWFVAALAGYGRAVSAQRVMQYSPLDVGPVGAAHEPMMVTCMRAALAATSGGTRADINKARAVGTAELAAHVVEHEWRRWIESAADPRWKINAPGVTDTALAEAVLLLVMASPITTVDATRVVRRLERLRTPEGMPAAVVAWAQHLYPNSADSAVMDEEAPSATRTEIEDSRRPLVEPKPEFVRAALVAEATAPRWSAIHSAMFRRDSDEVPTAHSAIVGIVRAAGWFPHVVDLLERVLENDADASVPIIEAAVLAGPTARVATRSLLLKVVDQENISDDKIKKLVEATDVAGLSEVRVKLAELAVDRARISAAETNGSTSARLASSLDDFGTALREASKNQRAVEVCEEATALWRKVAAFTPSDEHVDHLVRSLTRLARSYQKVGDYERALTASREAVETSQKLVAKDASFSFSLALALHCLGDIFHEMAAYREAVTCGREAVALWKKVAEDGSVDENYELARAMNCLGATLGELGEHQQSLAILLEAVVLWQRLSKAYPQRYRANFAKALGNVAVARRNVGECREALALHRQVLQLWRELRESEPSRYESEFATAYHNLAGSLYENGNYLSAQDMCTSAIALLRDLCETGPSSHCIDLARTLAILGVCQAGLADYQRSMSSHEEAVQLLRNVEDKNSNLTKAALGSVLVNYSSSQRAVADLPRALESAREAAVVLRPLAASEPTSYTPTLAAAMHNLAIIAIELGRDNEFLDIRTETVAWWQRVSEAHPHEFGSNYSTARTELLRLFADRGLDLEVALAAIERVRARLPDSPHGN